jgi:hypothetical protein
MLETHGSAVVNGVAVDALSCFEAQLNSMINLKHCPQFWLSMAEALRREQPSQGARQGHALRAPRLLRDGLRRAPTRAEGRS